MGKRKNVRRTALRGGWLVFVFLFGFLLAAFASWQLLSGWREDAAARNEYVTLRDEMERAQFPDTHRMDMSPFMEQNPDFVGWIFVEGTPISYPVVQGPDNAMYLHTTFLGQENPSGSIFMDYRAAQAFDTPLAILYGHNMRDGSMFASLHQFIYPEFSGNYPVITIINADGERLIYQVFEVRWAEAQDAVYAVDPTDNLATIAFFENAPDGASQFLVLSTCAPPPNRTGRLLVLASYVPE